jgi:hypothetical protein
VRKNNKENDFTSDPSSAECSSSDNNQEKTRKKATVLTSTSNREKKNRSRGGAIGQKATKAAIRVDENSKKRSEELNKIHLQLMESNNIAMKRLVEQQRATDTLTIAQAHAACQEKGDKDGADEMHAIMLQFARAARKRHLESANHPEVLELNSD